MLVISISYFKACNNFQYDEPSVKELIKFCLGFIDGATVD